MYGTRQSEYWSTYLASARTIKIINIPISFKIIASVIVYCDCYHTSSTTTIIQFFVIDFPVSILPFPFQHGREADTTWQKEKKKKKKKNRLSKEKKATEDKQQFFPTQRPGLTRSSNNKDK